MGTPFDDAAYVEAKAAFDAADYGRCLAILTPIAEVGHAGAQCLMGCLYHLGLGVAENLPLAAQWYRRASDGGDGVASNNLGTMFYSGQGMACDLKEAKRLYALAGEQGFVHAPPWE